MISRNKLNNGSLGDYCELLSASAFIAAGYEVAFPYGNQYGWDFLVSEAMSGVWFRVQVKTCKALENGDNPAAHIYRGDKNKSNYTEKDMDILVVVHPETGTMWKVPIREFAGTRRVELRDEFVWSGNVVRQSSPLSGEKKDLVIARLQRTLEVTHVRQAEERASIKASLPVEQPDCIAKDTWDMVTRWCDGQGYKKISNDYKTTHAAIRQRIIRGLRRLGAAPLPESFLKSLDQTDRKKMDRSKAAPRYNPPDPAQGTLLP